MNNSIERSCTMTMTTSKRGKVTIGMAGKGRATIDWGDGSEVETHTLRDYDELSDENEWLYKYSHGYSGKSSRTITITGKNITNLLLLGCELTSLDVSNCTALTGLVCNGYQLTSLNVNNCTALTALICFNCRLSGLDVSKCTALTELNCYGSRLTSLNVSNCTGLTELDCSRNQLTGLDIGNCTALTKLDCSRNQFTSLDVNNCTALTELDCSGNQLTSLNLSNCTDMTKLDCSKNQLTSLDISKNIALTKLDCSGNQFTIAEVNSKRVLFQPIQFSKLLDIEKYNNENSAIMTGVSLEDTAEQMQELLDIINEKFKASGFLNSEGSIADIRPIKGNVREETGDYRKDSILIFGEKTNLQSKQMEYGSDYYFIKRTRDFVVNFRDDYFFDDMP